MIFQGLSKTLGIQNLMHPCHLGCPLFIGDFSLGGTLIGHYQLFYSAFTVRIIKQTIFLGVLKNTMSVWGGGKTPLERHFEHSTCLHVM